jgi:hypothetical protein
VTLSLAAFQVSSYGHGRTIGEQANAFCSPSNVGGVVSAAEDGGVLGGGGDVPGGGRGVPGGSVPLGPGARVEGWAPRLTWSVNRPTMPRMTREVGQLARSACRALKLLDPPVVCAGAPAAAELAWVK